MGLHNIIETSAMSVSGWGQCPKNISMVHGQRHCNVVQKCILWVWSNILFQVTREGCIPYEVACIGTGVNKDPLAVEEMLELCADTTLDGLSLVAVTTDTEEVVASVFCKLQVGLDLYRKVKKNPRLNKTRYLYLP